MLYSSKSQQNSSIICYFFVTRRTKEKTAGINPPFWFYLFLVFRSASADFILTKKLLEEIDYFEEETCDATFIAVA